MVVGGSFTSIGGQPFGRIARWDGQNWHALGAGIGDGFVDALAVHDDGAGPSLFVGGGFNTAGGGTATRIARWNGSTWSPVGSDLFRGDPGVGNILVFDDGNGPNLFVEGMSGVNNTSLRGVLRWNGQNWSRVGTEVFAPAAIHALTVHDDGNGDALYAGGEFPSVGGLPGTHGIVKWNGVAWTSVGGGITSAFGSIWSMCSFNGDLYCGSSFNPIGGTQITGLGRWDGSTWHDVPGLDDYGDKQLIVFSLYVHDDGAGDALIVGGRFAGAVGNGSRNIVRWDGKNWSALGGGVWGVGLGQWGDVEEIASMDSDAGRTLFVGGRFTVVDDAPWRYMSAWQSCDLTCFADLNGDNVVNFADLNLLLNDYNDVASGLPGDLDGDDDVDFADLNLLLGAYNSAC